MRREDIGDLVVFAAVAQEQSFTRAANKLGTSQSALSHTVRRLEARVGVRLLSRTTRRVVATDAGERLLATLLPALDSIDAELTSLGELRDRPAGIVRISAADHAAHGVLWPVLERLIPAYPDIHVELNLDAGLTDIVAERFDAGVRLGEQLAKDMIAIPIGPRLRMVVVGAPSYFERNPVPTTPGELMQHRCLNLRMPTSGALMPWEFEKDGRESKVRVEGPFTFNSVPLIVKAALAGFGLACVMEDHVHDFVAEGRLTQVLDTWCPSFPGYYLYYPSNRQLSAAFKVVADALRHRT